MMINIIEKNNIENWVDKLPTHGSYKIIQGKINNQQYYLSVYLEYEPEKKTKDLLVQGIRINCWSSKSEKVFHSRQMKKENITVDNVINELTEALKEADQKCIHKNSVEVKKSKCISELVCKDCNAKFSVDSSD